MSTYILMKLFESVPHKYDKGIKIITLGAVDKAYDRLISLVKKNMKVLDIGCGTGALLLRAAVKGAFVKGIDINPGMLDIAKKRAKEAHLDHITEFCEMGVAELEQEKSGLYDVVMSGLCFSEFTDQELQFTLMQSKRILKDGGLLLLADEVKPISPVIRFFFFFLRCILVVITWIMTRTTTRPVKNLRTRVENAGLSVISEKRTACGSFIELTAKKEENIT